MTKALIAIALVAFCSAAALAQGTCDATGMQTCASQFSTCTTNAGSSGDMSAVCKCFGPYIECGKALPGCEAVFEAACAQSVTALAPTCPEISSDSCGGALSDGSDASPCGAKSLACAEASTTCMMDGKPMCDCMAEMFACVSADPTCLDATYVAGCKAQVEQLKAQCPKITDSVCTASPASSHPTDASSSKKTDPSGSKGTASSSNGNGDDDGETCDVVKLTACTQDYVKCYGTDTKRTCVCFGEQAKCISALPGCQKYYEPTCKQTVTALKQQYCPALDEGVCTGKDTDAAGSLLVSTGLLAAAATLAAVFGL